MRPADVACNRAGVSSLLSDGDNTHDYATKQRGDRDAVLIIDEITFLKTGVPSTGAQRQFSTPPGGLELPGRVSLAYASLHGLIRLLTRAEPPACLG